MSDTTDAEKLRVLRDEVYRLTGENRQLVNENARLNGQTCSESDLVAGLRAEVASLEQKLAAVVELAESRGHYINDQMYQPPERLVVAVAEPTA